MFFLGPYLLCHLVSSAAHKHLVIILAGSPVTSEYTKSTAHGDARRPSTVTGHTRRPLWFHLPPTHTDRHTHTLSSRPFWRCNGPLKAGGNLSPPVTEAKGNRISQPHQHTNSSNTTGNDSKMSELPLSQYVSVYLDTDRRVDRQTVWTALYLTTHQSRPTWWVEER